MVPKNKVFISITNTDTLRVRDRVSEFWDEKAANDERMLWVGI